MSVKASVADEARSSSPEERRAAAAAAGCSRVVGQHEEKASGLLLMDA